MENTSKKSVRLPTFDGSEKQFQVWWTRFTACAAVYKFAAVLKIGGELDMPANNMDVPDTTTPEGKALAKAQAAAKQQNATAMANLTMAFTSEATMGLVYKARLQNGLMGWHI
jgi:hypothetical protein